MRVTKWGEYGILCCVYLARKGPDACVGASEIAEHQSIPLQYTQQILQRLRKGGVIASVRGPGGGYKIARPAERISLKEILDAAEGFTFQVICESKSIICDSSECLLKDTWYELRDAVDRVLESKSLAMMVKHECRHQHSTAAQVVNIAQGAAARK